MNVSKELITIANNRAFAYSIKGKNNQHLMSELLSVTSFLDNHYSDVTLGQRGWHVRHSDYNLQLCPVCNPKSSAKSLLEVELQDYIREIYNGIVIDNCRSVIKNITKNNAKLELDVYLPELKLAFEFNGDKFHCNPKFYSSTDVSEITHEIASNVWKKDARKAELCKQKGILLFIVWEDDWIHQQ